MTDEEKPSILGDPHHNRADARMAARLISLGVISEEKARALLGLAFTLAAHAGKKQNVRDFAAAMAVPIACVKLEHERERLDMDKANGPQGTSVNIDNNVTVISWEPLGERADAPDPVEAKIAALKAVTHVNGTNGVANGDNDK